MTQPIKSHGRELDEPLEQAKIPQGELVLAQVRGMVGPNIEVEFYLAGQAYKLVAATTVPLASDAVGRQVVLSFINQDIQQPVILGLIHSALYHMIEHFEASPVTEPEPQEESQLLVDGNHVTVEASEQLQLKCGDASITLTKEGKILIRGKYLLNRASGINRIVGGSVQVN